MENITENITFAHKVKSEIYKNRLLRVHFKHAQAYGLLMFGKSFDSRAISLTTEHKNVTKLYSNLITDLIGITDSITTKEIKHGSHTIYTVSVDSASDRSKILSYFGHRSNIIEINSDNFIKDGDLAGFLSGAYLACGNITDPKKSYHLEFVVQDKDYSKILCGEISKLIREPKTTRRRNIDVVYFKESEHIEDMLTLIGASNCALEMMEVKIYKNLRNKVNRMTNCETANIEKTVNASSAQVGDINYIFEMRGESYLPDELREIAKLRLENPDMSLRELGENLSEQISRSGINHRLKKISTIAQSLRTQK